MIFRCLHLEMDRGVFEQEDYQAPLGEDPTKRPVVLNLPFTSECIKIIERWTGKFDNFVYVQLPDDFDLDEYPKLKFTINSGNKTMNQSLHCLAEKMELGFRLHFYIARHSFASWAINRGIDVKTISYLTGHSTSAVIEKVYAKLFPETLSDVVYDKLDFFCFVKKTY